MANTLIQIRKSTTANTPSSLSPAELAFTSNGDTLWIGSPSGSNTANVIHIASKISYAGNSTQIGATASGSNSELASTYAIKQFVDSKVANTNLSNLNDVNTSGVSNNNILVYNASTSDWEDHTIGGTANQITVSFVSQDITLSIPNTVSVNTLTTTGNVVIGGTSNVTGISHFFDIVHVHTDGPLSTAHLTNPIVALTANTDSFTQISLQNFSAGVNSSSDFIAYPNNTQADDNTGFIDLGITGNNFADAAFSVTGKNDGYVFASARSGASLSGSLVLATDSTGTNNDIKFFVGGFTFNANSPHMVLTGNNRNFGINNANPTHKISVEGTARFAGNTDVVGTANVSTALNVGANVNLTTSGITIGNSSVNLSANSSYLRVEGFNVNNSVLNLPGNINIYTANVSTSINVGANVNLTTTSISVGNSTVNTQITAGNVALNGSQITIGSGASNTSISNGDITATGTANVATAINVGANVNLTTSSITVGNSTVNSYITSSSVAFDGVLSAGNTTINGTLAAGNTTITGDLTVTGTVTTVDSTNLIVEDSLIRLARNQSNTGTFVDAVDIGFYGVYGNTSSTIYTGLARDASANVYVLFDGLTQSPDNVVNTSAISITTLQAYLTSGALVSNTTTVAITANSTVNVAIVANTLTLSAALGVGSGGTGQSSLTTNAVLVGNNTGAVTQVSSATEGHVLQINASGAPTFGVLDGGSF